MKNLRRVGAGGTRALAFIAAAAAALAACAESGPPPCTSTRRPLVLVHGLLASGDTFALHEKRFTANGYCPRDLHVLDWDTLGSRDASLAALDRLVDAARAASGDGRVDLAGHSAGGGLGYLYLDAPARAAKISRYAHIGSFRQERAAGPEGAIPTLNLWSEDDRIITEKGDIPGAVNVRLAGDDHYQVATSAASFDALFRFFNDGEAPRTTAIAREEVAWVEGRAVTLGENAVLAGATVEVFALDPDSGARLGGKPAARFTADAEGRWGPFRADPDARYAFRLTAAEGDSPPVTYYREPALRSSRLVYLRGLPARDSFAGAFLGGVPVEDDEQAVIVVFSANRGLDGRTDTLQVGEAEFDLARIAPPERNTVALFLFDGNANRQSEGTALPAFSSAPFLGGADLFLAPADDATVAVRLSGRVLHVARAAAFREVGIAVFE